jgi:2-polyprenyl-6-methoxyphenol hydroxylase-like FAD-dependent oxidoreductase
VLAKGAYFVAHHLTRGRFYWIGTRASAEPQPLERSRRKPEAVRWFSDWIEPVRALIDATPESSLLVNDIYGCARVEYGPRGNALLVGDAAHASAPQLGQGAGLALEDAVLLAHHLRAHGWPEAGRRFANARRERAQRVVEKSQGVADQYHMTSRVGVALRNSVLRAMPRSALLRKAAWASAIDLPELVPGESRPAGPRRAPLTNP